MEVILYKSNKLQEQIDLNQVILQICLKYFQVIMLIILMTRGQRRANKRDSLRRLQAEGQWMDGSGEHWKDYGVETISNR